MPSHELKERLMWCTVTAAFLFGAALVISLIFALGWFVVLGMVAGFAVCLLMSHLTHEMVLSDRPPSLDQAMARFRRPDAPVRD